MLPIPDLLQQAQLTPTAMQADMLRAATATDGAAHLLLLAPTGTGKTLAYLLPMLQLLCPESPERPESPENPENPENPERPERPAPLASPAGPAAIIVVPTRELALQADEMLARLKSGVKSQCLYGGRPTMDEHRRLREVRPQVVFATPGRLNDHLDKGNIAASAVRILVIDEYDKCLEMGFRDEVTRIAARLPRVEHCWLTSATATEDARLLAAQLPGGGRLQTLDYLDADSRAAARRIRLHSVTSPERDKLETLGRLLTAIGGAPAIVFVAHRESAERVGRYLDAEGFDSVTYHGGMEQERREKALGKFRGSCANVMVSTDIAARGLDIPEVEAVVHYHLPDSEATFTHRIGRSARWEATGTAYLILGPDETLPPYAADATPFAVGRTPVRPTPCRMAALYIGRGRKEKVSRADVVGFLCKQGALTAADIGRIDLADHHVIVSLRRECLADVIRRVAGQKIKGLKTHYLPA